jgi:glycosyltransferase involved in cell wall biosynthesis
MKICLISEAKSIHTQRWAESLANAGCDVHLISTSEGNYEKAKLYDQQIYSKNPIIQIISNNRTKRLFKRINPDIFHIFGLFAISSLGTMVLAKGLKNLVISVWGSDVIPVFDFESYKEKYIKKYLLNKADHLVVTSEYLKSKTEKYLFDPKKIEVAPWGVKLNEFYPKLDNPNEETIKIGFAKKIHFLSGPDIALKAFKYALEKCNKKLILKIAGDGPMTSDLKNEAEKLGIDKSIEWLGWLAGTDALREFYHSIDIFLMPSRRESFGVSATEASASGLPIIASRFGGIPEIVSNGKSGILIDCERTKKFGEALILLAENRNLRKTMGAEGRKIIEKRFDWNSCFNRMIDIYKNLANNSMG